MHYLMLVTITAEPSATSQTVRDEVSHQLVNDDSFCGDGGRFGTPICDWFVIGGRWSGLLGKTLIGSAYESALMERFPELANSFWPESLVAEHESELNALWQENGGQGPSPYVRTENSDTSYEDDAMLITPELYATHLAPFEGESLVHDGCYCEFVDLDEESLLPDFIGRKWLVVVDYHN